MNIILTGSAGFIGTHLMEKLIDEGHNVFSVDRKTGPDVESLTSAFIAFSCNIVIHLAAIADVKSSISNPQKYWDENVTVTKALQEKCAESNTPLIYASSSCAHKWWLSPYGTTKYVNETTARTGQIGLRFTTVYGEGSRPNMFVPKLVAQDLEYATDCVRDFIHVDDVVGVILDLINMTQEERDKENPVLEVGTGVSTNVFDIATEYSMPPFEKREREVCEAHDNTVKREDLASFIEKKTMKKLENYLNEKTGRLDHE